MCSLFGRHNLSLFLGIPPHVRAKKKGRGCGPVRKVAEERPDPNGDDRVIAIIDDDACLIDHFVPDDIVNPITGRLIAHGLHIDRHGYHLGEGSNYRKNHLSERVTVSTQSSSRPQPRASSLLGL